MAAGYDGAVRRGGAQEAAGQRCVARSATARPKPLGHASVVLLLAVVLLLGDGACKEGLEEVHRDWGVQPPHVGVG